MIEEHAMTTQIITTPAGDRLVVIPEAEYRALVETAEDAADIAAIHEFRRKLAAGEEELVPADVVDRLINGESPIRVWREHRGLGIKGLAKQAGIAAPYLSQMETGKRAGTIETMRRLADALGLTIDDLV